MNKQPLLISVGLYVAACALPALILRTGQGLDQSKWHSHHYQSLPGFELLTIGVLFGWLRGNFAAFANFPLWFSWFAFANGSYAAARTACLIALALSLATFQLLFQGMWFDEAASKVGFLAAPHIGYFCWIGGMVVILLASLGALKEKSIQVVFKPSQSSL